MAVSPASPGPGATETGVLHEDRKDRGELVQVLNRGRTQRVVFEDHKEPGCVAAAGPGGCA